MEAPPRGGRLLALAETVAALIGAIALTLVAHVLYLLAIGGSLPRAGTEWLERVPALLILQSLVFAGVGGALIRTIRARDPSPPRMGPLAAVLAGIAGAVAAFVASAAIGALLRTLGIHVREQDWVLALAEEPSALLRLAPLLVAVVPFAEEIFFRGYMFRVLTRRVGAGTGYTVSSLLFGLVHGNPSGLPVYVAVGFVLAFVYRRSGRLVAPITAHMGFNSIVVASLVWRA